MIFNEIKSKSILSDSKIYKYVINPYVGCQFGCSYCYARFMKRFTKHKEAWGEFVDIKINAQELLEKQILKKRKDTIWISGVCDPYQPIESKYKLTRSCLSVLIKNDWPFVIQTRSPLVLRDLDILKGYKNCSVGLTIPTADDKIRNLFEPKSSKISDRIDALKQLHSSGIHTYVMIAPILPSSEGLINFLEGFVDFVYVDRMNYSNAYKIYKENNLEDYMQNEYFHIVSKEIDEKCKSLKIECKVLF